MSAGPDPLEATLACVLDLRHPASYLALGPTLALGAELGVEVDWLPLAAPPLRSPTVPRPDDDRGRLHRRHRARFLAREIDVYARVQGLVVREIYRRPDSMAFHLGWLWLRAHHHEHLEPFLQEGFRAYWACELDPSSPAAVAEQIRRVGGDPGELEAWAREEGPAALGRIVEALRSGGVFTVPAYRVLGEVFLGRQHLPMIRWMLDGRKGPGPI